MNSTPKTVGCLQLPHVSCQTPTTGRNPQREIYGCPGGPDTLLDYLIACGFNFTFWGIYKLRKGFDQRLHLLMMLWLCMLPVWYTCHAVGMSLRLNVFPLSSFQCKLSLQYELCIIVFCTWRRIIFNILTSRFLCFFFFNLSEICQSFSFGVLGFTPGLCNRNPWSVVANLCQGLARLDPNADSSRESEAVEWFIEKKKKKKGLQTGAGNVQVDRQMEVTWATGTQEWSPWKL